LAPRLWAFERRAGLISPQELAQRRDAWIRAWRPKTAPFYRGFLWLQAYAETVETPDEARAALEVLPEFGGVPPFRRYTGVSVGRVYWLAGRTDEAIPLLEAEAHACAGVRWPVEHVLASYVLGRALEDKGDVTGACAAFRAVLERWGHPKPRSVTAEDARRRFRNLGCSPPPPG
jgi:hypothetical protein